MEDIDQTQFGTKVIEIKKPDFKKGIALAKNGDTLIVHSGLYKEGNIIIDKYNRKFFN